MEILPKIFSPGRSGHSVGLSELQKHPRGDSEPLQSDASVASQTVFVRMCRPGSSIRVLRRAGTRLRRAGTRDSKWPRDSLSGWQILHVSNKPHRLVDIINSIAYNCKQKLFFGAMRHYYHNLRLANCLFYLQIKWFIRLSDTMFPHLSSYSG